MWTQFFLDWNKKTRVNGLTISIFLRCLWDQKRFMQTKKTTGKIKILLDGRTNELITEHGWSTFVASQDLTDLTDTRLWREAHSIRWFLLFISIFIRLNLLINHAMNNEISMDICVYILVWWILVQVLMHLQRSWNCANAHITEQQHNNPHPVTLTNSYQSSTEDFALVGCCCFACFSFDSII